MKEKGDMLRVLVIWLDESELGVTRTTTDEQNKFV